MNFLCFGDKNNKSILFIHEFPINNILYCIIKVIKSVAFYIQHKCTRIFPLALNCRICYIINRKGKATEAALPPEQ